MKSLPKLRPNIWDALVALAVVLLAVACVAVTWLGSTDTDLQAVISVDGAEVERIDLTKLDEPVEKWCRPTAIPCIWLWMHPV